jgi:hypothetical protein
VADQDQASTERAPDKVLNPVPVTPSRETERPAGLAFDVEQGADLPGVPAGDQTTKNPGAAAGAGDGGRRGASPSRRPSPEGRAGGAGGTSAVSTMIGARGLRYGRKQALG